MNTACTSWLTTKVIPVTAARHRVPTVVVMLGLIMGTGNLVGQDRIRIVETPRTAMRERSVTPQPRTSTAQLQRKSVPKSNATEEHFVTEMRDQYRTVYVPVIEQQTAPAPVWWDPLGLSARTFRPRPVVRWEARVEKVRVPVRFRELVAETTELRQATSSSSSSSRSGSTALGSGKRAGLNERPVIR